MAEPQISFMSVSSIGSDGKRVKLSKSLFRQVLGEYPFIKVPEQHGFVVLSKAGLQRPDRVFPKPSKMRGQLLGFVNYFWAGCGMGCTCELAYKDNDLVLRDMKSMPGREFRHVLWLIGSTGELRRCLMSERLLKAIRQQDMPQLFLGSILFG